MLALLLKERIDKRVVPAVAPLPFVVRQTVYREEAAQSRRRPVNCATILAVFAAENTIPVGLVSPISPTRPTKHNPRTP